MTTEMETVDAEIVEPLPKKQAAQIDRKIRSAVKKMQTHWDALEDQWNTLKELVTEAKSNNAHLSLGFSSWTAYVSDAIQVRPRNADERQELVTLLSGEGMSVRAIAQVTDVSRGTVQRDLEQGVTDGTPDDGPTTGLDGKTYTKPDKPEPEPDPESKDEPPQDHKPPPLTDDASEAIDALMIDLHELQLVVTDSRFNKARSQIHKRFGQQLADAVNQLSEIVDTVNVS